MEIGGFFEFSKNSGCEYHNDLIALNSGRNSLRYLIRINHICEILLPYYICDSVIDVCREERVEIEFFNIDTNFRPILASHSENKWVYIVDYFGLLTEREINSYHEKYPNLIIDCTQSFFKRIKNSHINVIYSCRKFFGVSDGAYLQCANTKAVELQIDSSANRLSHLAGRLETSASDYYDRYRSVEDEIAHLPLKRMSKFTQNVMCGIDYEKIASTRKQNYQYLFKRLGRYNKINCRITGIPFSYPLLLDSGETLRKELIKNKVYIPMLWENVIAESSEQPETYLAKNLCSIPIDQRYSCIEMDYICNVIENYFKEIGYEDQ